MYERDYRKQPAHKCQEKRRLPLKGMMTSAEKAKVIIRVEGSIPGAGLKHEEVLHPRDVTAEQLHPDITQ